MNTTTSERASGARDRRFAPDKKKKSFDEMDTRRWQKLLLWHNTLVRDLGHNLNLRELAETHGFSAPRASQILRGHERLTTDWMLIWAVVFRATPLAIFEDTWPYPEVFDQSRSSMSFVFNLPPTKREALSSVKTKRKNRARKTPSALSR